MESDAVIMKRNEYSKLKTLLVIFLGSLTCSLIMCIIVSFQNSPSLRNLKIISEADYEKTYNQKARRDVYTWSSEAQEWSLERSSERPSKRISRLSPCVWPECSKEEVNDRIINQLLLEKTEIDRFIKIKPSDYSFPTNQQVFLDNECSINKCLITYDNEDADVLIFQNSDVTNETLVKNRRHNQIWVAYLLESPVHTFDRRFDRIHRGRQKFNWTASYRSDSDLVTPYSKFVPFTDEIRQYLSLKYMKNYPKANSKANKLLAKVSKSHKSIIEGKSSSIVWFASNCKSANDRLEYAKELSKYIEVDIYGKCGNLTCDKWNQGSCLNMINAKYFFYLSFENSNCREYLTEKLYRNAYGYNDLNHLILPIVMGPPREDYERFAPPASFIHVDDFNSPRELADYLKSLETDLDSYYYYFRWKFAGRFVDTKFFCRLCAMAHLSIKTGKNKSYTSIKDWWNHYEGMNVVNKSKKSFESCEL